MLTERLSLRRPVPADIDAILRLHRDPRACAHNPSDLIGTRAEATERYRRWNEHWDRHGFGYWAVCNRNGDLLGFCGLKTMRLHEQPVLNLFYRLDPSAWGNGIATEAATAVIGWAGAHAPGQLIAARVRPANHASARVAVRAGLHRTPEHDVDGEDGPDWIYLSAPLTG
ncbi:GNAT family N-acetyltransferase [Micromonosporaceae bacterium Da 78-11]